MAKDTHVFGFSITLLFLSVLACPAGALAQTPVTKTAIESRLNLSGVLDRMVEKNVERANALQKYQGRRIYSLVYSGFPKSFQAEMVVDMTYEAPATKQFKIVSQSGSEWIIDRVLKRLLETEQEALTEENRERTALNSSNYDFNDIEYQEAPDRCTYVLAVQPKVPSKLLYRGRVWVDNKDFAVCRIEAEPAKNPSFWIKKTDIHHSYIKIGDFWLPFQNESVSSVRGGGRAVLTIKYASYEILTARGLEASNGASSSNSLPPSHSLN